MERPMAARDRAPWLLFLGSFLAYWLVGQILNQFHAHDIDNLMFGGDVSRVWHDLTRSDREPTSGIAVSSAHPLFVLLFHPVATVVSRILGGSDLMAALLVCHAAAALGNTFLYLILRRCGVGRSLAIAISIALGLTTAQLMFGSTTETYSFIPAATLGLAYLAMRTDSPFATAPVALLPFALNVALLPYALLAPPVVWLGRMRLRKWSRTVLLFWFAVLILGVGALLYQHVQYAETNFFDRTAQSAYNYYIHKSDVLARMFELAMFFVAFSVVGPKPITYGDAAHQAGFIHNRLSTYSTLGWLVALLWATVLLAASYANLRMLLRIRREHRALVLLCGGWLLGSFGFFFFYGFEMFLPCEFWTSFLLLWVGLGLHTLLVRHRSVRTPLTMIGVSMLALLVVNQAWFLLLFVRNYYDGPLLSLVMP
jgi:hypothetical protein